MQLKKLLLTATVLTCATPSFAQEELVKFGDFEQWITRTIKESGIVGGATKTLVEVGPNGTMSNNEPYTNRGGSPWATSNVYAKMMGVSKANVSVFKDKHNNGTCVRMTTNIEKAKAIGIINVTVLAGGSLFTGKMYEPISSTSNPMSKMSMGMPFTKRPKAIKFDYKVELTKEANRIRETGFSKTKEIAGKDYPMLTCVLQKRWEDADGNIHALRVGTAITRFKDATNWKEGQSFEIHYGDISNEPFFKSWMGLINGEGTLYAENSKGKNVKIIEEGWANENETPTHAIIKFDSSYAATSYIGTPGTSLYVDNVKWVY